MKEQPNYYAIISAEVRYDKNLTANAKLLYAEITALLNMNGECFATNKYFSNLYDKSVVTISKWVSELVANGYISTYYTIKEGTKEIERRYIRILKGGIKENYKGGIKENFKDNNKYYLKINILIIKGRLLKNQQLMILKNIVCGGIMVLMQKLFLISMRVKIG